MPSLAFFASVALIFLTTTTTANPIDTAQLGNADIVARAVELGPMQLEFDQNCLPTPEQRHRGQRGLDKVIRSLWDDAAKLARALKRGYDDKKHDEVFVDWLGADYDTDQYKEKVADIINKIDNVYSFNVKQNQVVRFSCNPSWCDTTRANARTWDIREQDPGRIIHNIIICHRTFDSDQPPLRKHLETYDGRNEEALRGQQILNNFDSSQDKILFHETTHFSTVKRNPPLLDYQYKSTGCWPYASRYGAKNTTENADSFVMAAVALTVQDYFGLPHPPKDRQAIRPQLPLPMQQNVLKGEEEQDFGGPPPGWVEPPADSWYRLQDDLSCNGVDNSHWITYDWMKDAIIEFCKDATRQWTENPITRSYNNGDSAVSLEVEWPEGSLWSSRSQCESVMYTIMHNCDGNDNEHNPLNFKRGGQLVSGNARYRITPTVMRYPTGTCSFHLNETVTRRVADYIVGNDATIRLSLQMFDANGNFHGSSGGEVIVKEDASFTYMGLYAPLMVTPVLRHDRMIRFDMGKNSWSTRDNLQNKAGGCQVGDWDGYSPVNGRQMDCRFPC